MSTNRAPVYMALVHYPILDRQGDIITTAVTNLDAHDGSRLSATYGLKKFFIVTPLHEQLSLVHRVRAHWVDGPGAKKTPTRRMALEHLEGAESLEAACKVIEDAHGKAPYLIGTSARKTEEEMTSYEDLRARFETEDTPFLVVFGTGWGLAEQELKPSIHAFLPPIIGPTPYNHLSVRAAMAITIDRLLGVHEVT